MGKSMISQPHSKRQLQDYRDIFNISRSNQDRKASTSQSSNHRRESTVSVATSKNPSHQIEQDKLISFEDYFVEDRNTTTSRDSSHQTRSERDRSMNGDSHKSKNVESKAISRHNSTIVMPNHSDSTKRDMIPHDTITAIKKSMNSNAKNGTKGNKRTISFQVS